MKKTIILVISICCIFLSKIPNCSASVELNNNSILKPTVLVVVSYYAHIDDKELKDSVQGILFNKLDANGFAPFISQDAYREYVRESKLNVDYDDLHNFFSKRDLRGIANEAKADYIAFLTITSQYLDSHFLTGRSSYAYNAELRILGANSNEYLYKDRTSIKGGMNQKTINQLINNLLSGFNVSSPASLSLVKNM